MSGLTWWGRARDAIRAAEECTTAAAGSLTPTTAYYALYQLDQARLRLDAAEEDIRRTIRSMENVATAEL